MPTIVKEFVKVFLVISNNANNLYTSVNQHTQQLQHETVVPACSIKLLNKEFMV